jgi:hypothetical protein
MEKKTNILQVLEKTYASPFETALRYLTILKVLNDLPLTPGELQLLAFTATRGSIASGSARQQFLTQHGSSKGTIANMVHSLTKAGYLIREKDAIRIHPSLRLDFTRELDLVIKLKLNQ